MKKIPTLFKRDPSDMSRVLREVNPECQWVLDGEGVATRKFDGTCVKFDGAQWWARREIKPGKDQPPGFVAEQHDDVTGKTVGWEPANGSGWWKYLVEAIEHGAVNHQNRWQSSFQPGTYELLGPKVNKNPEGIDGCHILVQHGLWLLDTTPRDFDGLERWMAGTKYEGIVWHHPDGRMAKLKKRDFSVSVGAKGDH